MSDTKDERESTDEKFRTIPLREEKVDITKQKQLKEEVHIKKKIVQETKTIQVPLKKEELVIKKRPLLKEEDGEKIWGEEETTIIPLREEKVDIHVTPVHTENIVIHKKKEKKIEEKQEIVKKEQINIEKKSFSDEGK